MKIVVDPGHLRSVSRTLEGAAAGLEAARRQLARASLPPMPAATAKMAESAIGRSKGLLSTVRSECNAMAAQLDKRRRFDPPEAFPTFEPTGKLTQDAVRRAQRLAKKYRDGSATIRDDMKFVEDQELQLQLFFELGQDDYGRYLEQLGARFELARDLINERTWKQRTDEDIEAWTQGHEDWMARYHLGWAYPKGFSTGWFKGGASLDAAIYSLYGAIRDQFGDDRRETWEGLGLPTNTEAIGDSIEHSIKNPDDFLKALVAWDKFAQGKIGEGLGEVGFTAATIWATGGVSSASAAVTSGRMTLAAWRTESLAYASMRTAARRADRLELEAKKLRREGEATRQPANVPGGRDRNINFGESRQRRQEADAAEVKAGRYREIAASAERRLNKAYQQRVASAQQSLANVLAALGFNVAGYRTPRAWLEAIWNIHSTTTPNQTPKPPASVKMKLNRAADGETNPRR